MSPRIKAFAVLIGVGMASSAGAAERTETSVGPSRSSAVQTQKAVGPKIEVNPAVRTQKAVGPLDVLRGADAEGRGSVGILTR